MRDAVFLPKFGPYVRVKQLRDGRLSVFMEVPKHLRPEGWPSTIQLPEIGTKTGKLSDLKFIERVRRDAARLKEQLDSRREAEKLRQRLAEHSFPELVEAYQASIRFRKLVPGRQYRNLRNARAIVEWAASRGYVSFDQIGKREIEEFLMGYDDRPSTLLDMRSVWNVLCTEAIALGWRRDNPAGSIRWKAPKPREAKLWEEEDVEAYAKFARRMGQPGLAAMIIVQFTAGQRLGDMRGARYNVNFNGEALTIKQSKTGARVRGPLPRSLCRLIAEARVPGSDFLFNDFETGGPFDNDNKLHQVFSSIRRGVVANGGRHLTMQTLRHSAVCEMARAGLTLPQIAAVTGHLNVTVNSIIERYVVDRDSLGAQAMKALHRNRGGQDDDFAETKELEYRDWLASKEREGDRSRLLIREDRFDADLAAMTGQSVRGFMMPRALIPWPAEDAGGGVN